MILDEDPAALLRHCVENFTIHTDKNAVDRIQHGLRRVDDLRRAKRREAEDALKALSRSHKQLETNHQDILTTNSHDSHAAQIVDLDTQKFKVAKAASDLETESERLESELASLKARLNDLERQGPEGDRMAQERRRLEDPTLLRLKVYRSLGIELNAAPDGTFESALIRGRAQDNLHVLKMDSKLSPLQCSNYLWNAI